MSERLGILVALVLSLASIEACAQTRTWGNNYNGQLGDGFNGSINSAHIDNPTPITIGGPADIVGASGGQNYSLAARSDGTVMTWGLGAQPVSLTPVPVTITNVIAVSAGGNKLALKADGTVWAWGGGLLGDYTTNGSAIPVQVGKGLFVSTPDFDNIIAIDSGLAHSLALKADGTVWAWGGNTSGQIGNGDTAPQYFPVKIAGLSNIIAIAAGEIHSAAVKSDGTVWVWGNNGAGQLGDGTTVGPYAGSIQLTPVQNTNISGVAQIAAGMRYNVALKSDGTVWAWGENELGSIGNGTNSQNACKCVTLPTQTTISNVTAIRAKVGWHTLARKIDGSIWAWGFNAHGQGGTGAISPEFPDHYGLLIPAQSIVGTGNAIFGAGSEHSLLSVPVVPVAAGAGVVARLGEANVTFANVTTPGNMTITAIDPGTVGLPPPATFVIQTNMQAYSIATTAVFDNATVCIKVPTVFALPVFNSLRILHVEGGALVDRTTSRAYSRREVCGVVTSFSPFLMATSLTPNLAGVSSRKAHGAGTFDLTLSP